jgi:hypothetical protein
VAHAIFGPKLTKLPFLKRQRFVFVGKLVTSSVEIHPIHPRVHHTFSSSLISTVFSRLSPGDPLSGYSLIFGASESSGRVFQRCLSFPITPLAVNNIVIAIISHVSSFLRMNPMTATQLVPKLHKTISCRAN